MSGPPTTATLLEAPSGASPKIAPSLGSELLVKLKSLETHFGRDDYDLPTTTASVERRKLDVREMMYLVSPVISIALGAVADSYSMLSREKRSFGLTTLLLSALVVADESSRFLTGWLCTLQTP